MRVAAGIALVMTLGGCAVTEPAYPPQLETPVGWIEPVAADAPPVEADWWRHFRSARLDELVAAALAGNPDLAIAAERVLQAELQLRGSHAARLPDASLGGNTNRRRNDPGSDQAAASSEATSVSLNVSYEVDLWGRLAAGARGDEALLGASRHDFDAARLSLQAAIASTWFQALALAERLQIAHRNLTVAERIYAIVQVRYRNGAANALDVSRQRTAVLSQRAAIHPLEVEYRQSMNALALLAGTPPAATALPSEVLGGVAVPDIGAGLPAELLVRRPDIAAAEARLAAAHANVAVARAALLPAIQLSAAGGVASAALLSLADPSSSLSVGASLSQVLFDGGQRQVRIDSARSQQRELVEAYRRTVLTALDEVEDSLGNAERHRRQELAQREIRDESARALSLSELRYREGAGDLLSVLDAQRTLFQAEEQVALQRLSRLNAAVDLYRALGGGWRPGLAADEPDFR